MTGQTEGAPAPVLGPSNGGCPFSLFCGGVGVGHTVGGSLPFSPSYHFDETGDYKPEYKHSRIRGFGKF